MAEAVPGLLPLYLFIPALRERLKDASLKGILLRVYPLFSLLVIVLERGDAVLSAAETVGEPREEDYVVVAGLVNELWSRH